MAPPPPGSPPLREPGAALETINVWRTRCKLPLAVDSTAQLIELQYNDSLGVYSKNPMFLRLSYTMAIVRLVNGVVELEQRGQYAQAVSTLAERIGLPRWLVDIRHEGTHTDLPALETLRMGTNIALQWLVAHYWSVQEEHLLNGLQSVREFLRSYHAAMEDEGGEETLVQLLNDVGKRIATNKVKSALVPLLTGAHSTLSLAANRAAGDDEDDDQSGFLLMSLMSGEMSKRFEFGYKMWNPLLRKCQVCWPHFTTCLFFCLLDELCNLESKQTGSRRDSRLGVRNYFLEGWTKKLLSDEWEAQCHADYNSPSKSKLKGEDSKCASISPPLGRSSSEREGESVVDAVDDRPGHETRLSWAVRAAKMCLAHPTDSTKRILKILHGFGIDAVDRLIRAEQVVQSVLLDRGADLKEDEPDSLELCSKEDDLSLMGTQLRVKRREVSEALDEVTVDRLKKMESFLASRRGGGSGNEAVSRENVRASEGNARVSTTAKRGLEDDVSKWVPCKSWVPCPIGAFVKRDVGAAVDPSSAKQQTSTSGNYKIVELTMADLSRMHHQRIEREKKAMQQDRAKKQKLQHSRHAEEGRKEKIAEQAQSVSSGIVFLT